MYLDTSHIFKHLSHIKFFSLFGISSFLGLSPFTPMDIFPISPPMVTPAIFIISLGALPKI